MVDTIPSAGNDTIQQLQALFNYATIGIVVTDQSGKIINFNKWAEIQFGYTTEEILGNFVEVLIPGQFDSTHVIQRTQYYAHPEPRTMGAGRDLYAQRKDSSVFPVEVSLSHYEFNGQTFVIAFVIDITIRKNNESVVLGQKAELEKVTKQLMELNAELEQRVEDRTKMLRETLAELERSKIELSEALESEKELGDMKSRFVTLTSHEFRTPLSTVLSSAYLLEQYTKNEGKTGKHIKKIKNAVGAMKNMLEDFLSLGKMEEGMIHIKKETISAEQCLAELHTVIEEMDQMLKPGQKISLHSSGTHNISADVNLLKSIMINLLSNAIKFSPEGAIIEVMCTLIESGGEIAVKDAGIGIADDDQQHLFQRFFRAKNAANIQGTGLGLHIVRKYLEMIDGKIEMTSAINKGSTFTIYLPAGNA